MPNGLRGKDSQAFLDRTEAEAYKERAAVAVSLLPPMSAHRTSSGADT
jgi:hypothetical protein